jgi:molecular chaperone DnaK (HSP70)
MVFQKLQFFGIATLLSASSTYGFFLNDVSTIKYLAIKEQSSSHNNYCRRYKNSRRNIPIRSSLAAEIGVGIDLGTTNSAIAFLNENNEPRIIEIPNNGRTMKSVVAFDSKYSNDNDDSVNFSHALVGNEAIEWEQQHKENVYRHVKRVIGTSINHITKETKAVVPHLVLADDTDDDYDDESNSKKKGKKTRYSQKKKKKKPSLEKILKDAVAYPTRLYSLNESSPNKNESSYISPEYISSCILQKLLMVASEHTGNTITRAVIGVPAYFNDAQRDATVRAANACGIEKVKLLREPEAAALAYGVDKDSDEEEELVLVFDLGGGTYDVSVLMVERGLTEIVCTSGNSQLGGTNFDAKIAQHVSKLVDGCCKTEESTGIILRAAELIRIYLSNNRIAHLALPLTEEGWLELQEVRDVIVTPPAKSEDDTTTGSRNSTHAFHEISRKDMEKICAKEFQDLIRPIREVAIMAGALLPGDTRPSIAESAIKMENLLSDAKQFYDDDDDDDDKTGDDETVVVDIRSAKKMQQNGRKKARQVAKQERKYREESRKVQDRLPDNKVRADGISGRPISRIVLVGGATRMPTIGRIISSLTGVVPQRTVDPDEAVALGCAVHVGVLDGDEEMGVVLNPMKAALLRAVIDKERREGGLSELFDEEAEFNRSL